MLEINTELYPESANTWDSVGYAYRTKGEDEKATEFYRKALEVDSELASALEAMAELQSD